MSCQVRSMILPGSRWRGLAAGVLAGVVALGAGSSAFAQLFTVLPGNNSTSANGRAPQGGRLYIRSVYYITPTEMNTSTFGAGVINSVGWRWNVAMPPAAAAPVAQSVDTTGTIKIYVQDSTDTAYSKGTSWATALTGMTLITDGTITIPATANEINIDVPSGGPATTSFATVAGHGVYVAFEYHTTTPLATPTASPIVMCVNNGTIATYQSQTALGDAMTTSTFRPETRFGFANISGTGACCHEDGTCMVGNLTNCSAPDLPQAVGSSCSPTAPFCPVVTSACCNLSTAACTYTVGTTCVTGSANLGAGTVCSPNSCPITGACCRNDGTCTYGNAAACAAAPAGIYRFNTGSCPPTPACAPAGTCCTQTGVCAAFAQFWCEGIGGVYTATGTPCSPNPCPQAGACCLSNGGCITVITDECFNTNGTFAGPGVACALGNCWTAPTLWNNGGIVTGGGAGSGGADVSVLPTNANIIGFGFGGANRLADEFVIPAGQLWTITRFKSYGYLTGSTSTTSPFTTMVLRVWDRDPRDPMAVSVFGDLTTNVLDLANTTFQNIYRTTAALGNADTQRPIWGPSVNMGNLQLGAGTYWVEWGNTDGGFVPPVTTFNHLPYGDALQWNGTGYGPVVDATFEAARYTVTAGKPTNIPFTLEGFTGVCCQANGSCVANAAAGSPTPTCASGTYNASATCSPNTCPQTASGVCCRGATCTTGVAQAACTVATGTAGAAFAASSSTCNGAAVSNSPCCFANYNKANGITVQDIFDFLGDWFGGSPYARTGSNGTPGSLAVQNIFDFLSNWFAGGC